MAVQEAVALWGTGTRCLAERAASALVSDILVTSGTITGGIATPNEMTRVMVVLEVTLEPLAGLVLTTSPLATAEELTRLVAMLARLIPSWVNAAVAAAAVSPRRSGITERLCWDDVTKYATTPAITTTNATPMSRPRLGLRRRRFTF